MTSVPRNLSLSCQLERAAILVSFDG